MWIVTAKGFLSVVSNRDEQTPENALLVRSRVREDIEDYAGFVEGRTSTCPQIIEIPQADYEHRCTTSRELFAKYLEQHAMAIDYPNFKSEVAKTSVPQARIYERVWAVLRDLSSE